MKRQLQRTLCAQLRDMRALLRESWGSLLLFVVIVTGGALLFHFFYTHADTGQHPSFSEALHATFALVFFETLLPFPKQWSLQALFFIIQGILNECGEGHSEMFLIPVYLFLW